MSKAKQDFSLCLLDADIIAYRCSVASQDEPQSVCATRIDDLVGFCLDQTVGFHMEGNLEAYLTGKGNYRYEIAKSFPYKGNRNDKVRPDHLEFAREYLVDNWGAIVVDGAEADDAIATRATEVGESAVIVSLDKDFLTVPGHYYNFVRDEWYYSTPRDALEYFYKQILTGDPADHIKGLYRVGPKKADKIVEGWQTEADLFDRVLKAYQESSSLEGDPYERLVENGRLLHLCRSQGEIWSPPNKD